MRAMLPWIDIHNWHVPICCSLLQFQMSVTLEEPQERWRQDMEQLGKVQEDMINHNALEV